MVNPCELPIARVRAEGAVVVIEVDAPEGVPGDPPPPPQEDRKTASSSVIRQVRTRMVGFLWLTK